jgi:hypothetical protein
MPEQCCRRTGLIVLNKTSVIDVQYSCVQQTLRHRRRGGCVLGRIREEFASVTLCCRKLGYVHQGLEQEA